MMEQIKRLIDPSLEALFGASNALNLAATQIHCMLIAINAGNKKVDQFALLTHIYDSLTFWRETTDEVESVLHDMQRMPWDTAGGYAAARDWSTGLQKRLNDVAHTAGVASGYAVPSQLREAFEALQPGQQGPFLDAVGTLVMSSFAYDSLCVEGFDFALSIAEEAMTPAEQEAAAHAEDAQEGGGCHE